MEFKWVIDGPFALSRELDERSKGTFCQTIKCYLVCGHLVDWQAEAEAAALAGFAIHPDLAVVEFNCQPAKVES